MNRSPWWDAQLWRSPDTIHLSADGKFHPVLSGNFPVFLACFDFSSGSRLAPSYHDHLEVLYVYSGAGYVTIQNQRSPIVGGNVVLIGANVFHVVERVPESDLRVIALHFLPEAVYAAGDSPHHFEFLRPFFDHSIERKAVLPVGAEVTKQATRFLEAISREFAGHKMHYQLAIISTLYDLLLTIVRHYVDFSEDVSDYLRKRARLVRLKPVFELIERDYREPLTLDTIADVAGMSRSYFCGFFRNVTGNTLTEYLSRFRVDKARELLLQSTLNITEIGYEVGFQNHSYFDKVFKKLHGITPHEFRSIQAESSS